MRIFQRRRNDGDKDRGRAQQGGGEDTPAAGGMAAGPGTGRGERKARKDKGSVRLTERDQMALQWVGDQYAVRIDQLQRLLGRQAQKTTKVEGAVGEATAAGVVERWGRLGFVETRKPFYKQPGWVWLSRHGLKQLDLPYSYREPALSLLQHIYWVNHARLFVEGEYRQNVEWTSERRLVPDRARERSRHYVDAEIQVQDYRVGIEIELTPKAKGSVEAIVRDLLQEYETIWYFTTPATRRLVEGAVSDSGADARERVKIYDLTQIA